MFSLHQVRIFLTTATQGSISRAAQVLYLSQPAVSQHIKALEKDLGVALLTRGRRGVALTPAGEVFLKYAQQMLLLADEAREVTHSAANQGQSMHYLHIGATPGVGACLLPYWMGRFSPVSQRVTPTLKILPTPELVHQVSQQEVAFAIIGDTLSRAVVEVTPLWAEEAVIVVGRSHEWWGQERVNPEALVGQPFVMRQNNSLAHAWELQSLAEYGINPQTVAEFNTPTAIKQAVIAGMGVALLPCFSIKNELDAGRLHPVRLDTGLFQRNLYFLWSQEGIRTFGVDLFIRFLLENFDKLPVKPIHTCSAESLQAVLAQAIAPS
jgi:DNA-binding transcriptional LysR family regulator